MLKTIKVVRMKPFMTVMGLLWFIVWVLDTKCTYSMIISNIWVVASLLEKEV